MAKTKKSVKTKKPTGLRIARNGSSFTATWKIGDKDYKGGQTFQWRINNGVWQALAVSTTATAKSFSVNLGNFAPATKKPALNKIDVRVQGKRKAYSDKKYKYVPKVSDWASQTFDVVIPPNPTSISATLNETLSNVCTFAWSVTTSNTNGAIFRDTQYETILVKDCTETNGTKLRWNSSQLGWATGTKTASGSLEITEDTALLAGASYTRWVRARSRGSQGNSGWSYGYHTYGIPLQAKITSASANRVEAGGYLVSVKWYAPANRSRPIDKTVVEYAIAVPDTGMECPDSASWTEAKTLRDTAGADGTAFSLDTVVGYDQCLFVRVNTYHDTEVTYGLPYMVDVGKLNAPSDLSVSTESSTYRATVTATNNSEVADSFLAIVYMTEADPTGFIIGIIPNGATSVTVQCPAWTSTDKIRFGVYSVVGSYTPTVRADGVTSYAVEAKMQSAQVEQGGVVPQAPTNVVLSPTNIPGTIRVVFDWAWSTADFAELSWSDHEDAWESTDEPETFTINSTHASQWNISGLETGIAWYVRVRLGAGSGDEVTYGAYSDIVSIDLSSAPAIPVLSLSDAVITEHGSVTASWAYVSTDGTPQAFAEVAEMSVVEGETAYTPLAQVETAQYVTIDVQSVGWATGESHSLVVRVVSASGRQSEGWSGPVPVLVAEPITATISSTSLVPQSITFDGVTHDINALTVMPLSITVEGAGEGGTTTVVIERAQTYVMDRPDENDFIGYEGETIALHTQTGEGEITFEQDSNELFGYLDDGASYRIIATVQDGLGQSAEARMDFEVHWAHQALMPSVKVVSDQENLVAIITPVAPSGVGSGDVCDIYRLSVDKPQLIYPNASFGEKYVDPYPTIGEYGGHRIVFKTVNGDYITANNELAWIDTYDMDGDYFSSPFNIIDYGDGAVYLQYNVDLQNQWEKDFKETKYLGGSVQGDWNPAVSRTGTLSTVVLADSDQETIEAMRRLAVHAGICHIRTKDGSSYPADVQVSESYHYSNGHRIVEFSLSITRVDPETYDGLTYAEWQHTQEI